MAGEDSANSRSRIWSAELLQSKWSIPIHDQETVEDRAGRYATYFTLDSEQLCHIAKRFDDEIEVGLQLHRDDPLRPWTKAQCSLKLLDTCVTKLPSGEEKSVAYALDFGGTNLRAVRATMTGGGKVSLTNYGTSLESVASDHPRGVLDKNATATELFNGFATCVKTLAEQEEDTNPAKIGFIFSFPMSQKSIKSAHLVNWTKEFETGRNTNDPVENMDVGALLNEALSRKCVKGEQVAVLNDTTSTMLCGCYERPPGAPPCCVGVILGTGVNGCYFQEDAPSFGYIGCVLNTELGAFNKGLPLTDIDLEVDFAHEACRGDQLFEKMVSGRYLGEVCRRLIIKVFQKSAPEFSWIRESMPCEAAAMIFNDDTADHSATDAVLNALWEWQLPVQTRAVVKRLADLVFDRSAALSAAVTTSMAKRTKRLQPAMGGVTVIVDGSLYTRNAKYAALLRKHINSILGSEMGNLIHLTSSVDASAKGGAILAAIQ